PIPINASAGMLLSLLVALIVTPWLSLKLLAGHASRHDAQDATTDLDGHVSTAGSMAARLHAVFERLFEPFLDPDKGARRRRWLFASMAGLVLLAASLVVFKLVVLKMLPFDNKS